MQSLEKFILRLARNERASSAVEYAVVLSLIVTVCAAALSALGDAAYDALWSAAEALK